MRELQKLHGCVQNKNMPYWLDGNNLIGQSASTAAADRKTRRAFLELLSSYTTGRGGRFLVFFDGDDPDRLASPKGVQVRYSAPFSTDSAILNKLNAIKSPSEVIVVTNDRALALACRNAGAKSMNWETFSRTMNSRTARGKSPEAGHSTIDLDEWIRFFGLDENSLK